MNDAIIPCITPTERSVFMKSALTCFLLLCFAVSADAREYIGRAEAFRTVDIHPEVSAKISGVHFAEGSFVKEGAVLFTLNSSQFQAQVQLEKAKLSHAQATLDGAAKYLSRLKAVGKRSVPGSDIDAADTKAKQAQAEVDEAKAELRIAQINLNNTKITAPISGYIGKADFTKGSYVTPDDSLVSIVQTDPARVSFAMTDRDFLAHRDIPAEYELVLADGTVLAGPQKAVQDFASNVMNPDTGTITIYLRVPNENHVLIPGAIVRVRVIYPASGE